MESTSDYNQHRKHYIELSNCLDRMVDVLMFKAPFTWPVWRTRLETFDSICKKKKNLEVFTTANAGSRGEIKVKFQNGKFGYVRFYEEGYLLIESPDGEIIFVMMLVVLKLNFLKFVINLHV